MTPFELSRPLRCPWSAGDFSGGTPPGGAPPGGAGGPAALLQVAVFRRVHGNSPVGCVAAAQDGSGAVVSGGRDGYLQRYTFVPAALPAALAAAAAATATAAANASVADAQTSTETSSDRQVSASELCSRNACEDPDRSSQPQPAALPAFAADQTRATRGTWHVATGAIPRAAGHEAGLEDQVEQLMTPQQPQQQQQQPRFLACLPLVDAEQTPASAPSSKARGGGKQRGNRHAAPAQRLQPQHQPLVCCLPRSHCLRTSSCILQPSISTASIAKWYSSRILLQNCCDRWDGEQLPCHLAVLIRRETQQPHIRLVHTRVSY